MRIFEKPGSIGRTPRTKRGMMFAGAARHAWFHVRLGSSSAPGFPCHGGAFLDHAEPCPEGPAQP